MVPDRQVLSRPHLCTHLNYRKRMARKEDTFACFIDFKKAFDCVNSNLYWKKLAVRFRLSGKFLLALKALYKDVCCSVDVNHTLTD